jgi:hypothetical protein
MDSSQSLVQCIFCDYGFQYGKASTIYKIPRTTLYNRMNFPNRKYKTGRATALTENEESKIATWIKDMQMRGCYTCKDAVKEVSGV